MEQHLPGQRVMLGGSLGTFFNTITPSEQLSAELYPTGPNWEEKIALYTIYPGENAGERDAQYSPLWLKAFGAQAVAVPGPASPEYWKPFSQPRKFDGILPVLWRVQDTTIYSIPQSSTALVHTMRPDRLVHRAPIHGLDTAELARYVDALDSASRPAGVHWTTPNSARIDASPGAGEVVSTQITYEPGWHASIDGVPVHVRADGIGLMVIDPARTGPCRIELRFDGGAEATYCRLASGLCLLPASLTLFVRSRKRPA